MRTQHGCGTGRDDCELVKLDFDVTGVDQSERMVELARGKIDDHGPALPPNVETYGVGAVGISML
ncbi:MAG: class I SAM-dependent methyltransferase [Desulfovibrio sp.]|uniref:class I SAM-dependent methyltransferase n=1 Tax=Desulfovibrio sp. 7SRBS1 TaxID=3378064 RepID=UPI003B3DBEFC